MADQFEMLVIEQRIDVLPRAGEEIVDTKDVCAVGEQPLAQMRPEKSGPGPSPRCAVADAYAPAKARNNPSQPTLGAASLVCLAN
jgi:hypothetical protein